MKLGHWKKYVTGKEHGARASLYMISIECDNLVGIPRTIEPNMATLSPTWPTSIQMLPTSRVPVDEQEAETRPITIYTRTQYPVVKRRKTLHHPSQLTSYSGPFSLPPAAHILDPKQIHVHVLDVALGERPHASDCRFDWPTPPRGVRYLDHCPFFIVGCIFLGRVLATCVLTEPRGIQ